MSGITQVKPTYDTMSLDELYRDVRAHHAKSEEIFAEAKQRGGLSAEAETALKAELQIVDSIEAVISRKESMEQYEARVRADAGKYATPANPPVHAPLRERDEADGQARRGRDARTIGRRFVEHADYRAAFPRGHIHSGNMLPRVELRVDGYSLREHKALLAGAASPGGGPLVQNDVQAVVRDARRPLTFLDLITRLTTDSDTIEWPSEVFTNAAATVAEATATTGTSGTKAESTLVYTTVTSPVQTIAHWIPVTTRMLADYSGIMGLIDASLMIGLDETLETQILTGDGNSPNLGGLTSLAGVQAHALGTDSTLDALFKMMVKVQVTGQAQPSAVILNPLNFQTIRLARENAATATLGAYLYGSPALAGPMTVWGRPLVEAQGLTANTGLVGDFSARRMVLWDRETATVRTGYIDQMFVRNMIAVLAELRATFTVFRASAVAKVTGLS